MKKKMVKYIGMSAIAFGAVVGSAQAAIDSTAMDAVKADAEAWVTYGVGAAVSMLGLGLAYVGGRWAYRKIKGGISAA